MAQPNLLDLARCQLGLSSFVTVSKEYLQELKAHVATAPNDVNFRVETTPGTGYGVVICLETLCKKQKAQIPLTRNAKVPDGGKSMGVGALSEYRIHCASEQHARSRSARLRDSRNETKSGVTKGTAHGSAVRNAISGSVKKKPTPAYKRAYDFIYDTGEQSTSKPPAGSPPKKMKTESLSSSVPKVHKAPQSSIQEQQEITALRDEIDSLKESMTVIQGLIQDIENKAIGGPDTIPLEDKVDMEQYLRDLEGYELRWAGCEEKLAAVQKNVGKKRIIPSSSESDIDSLHTPNVASSSNAMPSQKRVLPSSWSALASSSRSARSSSVTHTIPRANALPYSGSRPRSTASPVYSPAAVSQPAAWPPGIPLAFIENPINPVGVPFIKPEAKVKPEELLDFIISSSKSKDVASSSLTDALHQLGLGNVNEVLPGMNVPLHPHQVIGVAWMIEREASEERKERGGMLADEMGLGKTVQMTALIVSRPSPNKRPTLVILPLNIMNQWKKELEDKSGGGLKCGVYHGNKRKLFQAVEDFKAYDVILTTYQTMSREWSADPKHRRPGLLFQVKFHRIVLDESQMIRTKETITSRAVASLQGRYKWCLTGTPIINCLEDLFPFFRFLGIQPFCEYSVYRARISVLEKNDPQQATQRLQAVLNDFLLRRRKDAMMNGQKLVDLPKKNVNLVSLKFSPKEREIYDMFERRAQGIMRGFIKTQTVTRNTNNMLVELLRLRQMCTHPALVKELDLEEFESDVKGKGKAPSKDSELARAERLLGTQFIARMQEKLLREEREAVAGDMEAPDATSLNEEECPICYDVYTDAVVTSCGHSFCRECIMSALTSAPCPEGMKPDERPCPSCRSKISPTLLFPRSIFKLGQRQKEGMKDDDAAMLDVEELMPVFTPSTKMTWMLDKIRELVQTRPNEKLLVISQWTECLALVGGYLDKQGIGYVKYQGGMNSKKRDQALVQFNSAGCQARVLLLSMKAGGVGLNLDRANNIISLDLGWSRAVEEQAFDRVHRMTQEREVYVSRLVIENTVEDRILRLQDRKQSLADGSLGEGAGNKRIKKLTVEDWANLFGLDARGNRLG